MIYGAVRNIGVDFEYLTGGWDDLCNHPPPMLCTGENILTKKKKNG